MPCFSINVANFLLTYRTIHMLIQMSQYTNTILAIYFEKLLVILSPFAFVGQKKYHFDGLNNVLCPKTQSQTQIPNAICSLLQCSNVLLVCHVSL